MSLFFLCMELVLLALLRFMGITEIPDVLAVVLILSYSVAYIVCVPNKRHCKNCASALIVGYLFRIALLFFDIYGKDIYGLPNSGSDSVGFFYNAVSFANSGLNRMGAFSMTMGLFFRYFGISQLFGQFIVMLCSIVSLEYAAKSLELIGLDEKRLSIGMWVVCLLPNFAILSVIFLRESLVTMFVSLSLFEFIKWIKMKKEHSFVFAIVLTFGAMYYHSGAIAVPIGYLLSRIIYDNKTEKLHISISNILAVGILLLIGTYVLNRYGDGFLVKFASINSLEDIANESQLGGSSYARYVGNSSSLINIVIFTIPRIMFFLFSPMPWMIRGISDIIAFCFSSCFYILTVYQFLRYLHSGGKENRGIVLVIFIVAMSAAFVFGWGTANTGTACRHRDKMTIVWAILYSLTLQNKSERKQSSLRT